MTTTQHSHQMKHNKTIKKLQDAINSNFKDPMYHAMISEYATTVSELEGLEIIDIAHERAGSREDVICYSKAHALCANVSSEVRAEAEETVRDTGGFADDELSYNGIAAKIAYWIVYQAYYDQMQEELKELIAVLEQHVESQEDIMDELSDADREVYEEDMQATEDLIFTLQDK